MTNLEKFKGEITTGLDLDLLWSILQNSGGGGAVNVSNLNKEETQILVTQLIQSLIITVQATNSQLDSNIITEISALNNIRTTATTENATQNTSTQAVKTAVDLVRTTATTENATQNTSTQAVKTAVDLVRTTATTENATQNTSVQAVKTAVDLVRTTATTENATQNTSIQAVKNSLDKRFFYTQNGVNAIVHTTGAGVGQNEIASAFRGVHIRVKAGTAQVVLGNPAGVFVQFKDASNQFNLQTTLGVGYWIIDYVPTYFTVLTLATSNIDVVVF